MMECENFGLEVGKHRIDARNSNFEIKYFTNRNQK